jgi:hypothetical protein
MKALRSASTLLLGVLLASGIASAQGLAVENETGKKIVLSRADIEALDHAKVTVTEHSSDAVTFEGVKLAAVLEKAGITFGESMKGKRMASCLLVEAADGYRAVVALRKSTRRSPRSRSFSPSCATANP